MTFNWILAAVVGGVLAILLDVILGRVIAWFVRVRRS